MSAEVIRVGAGILSHSKVWPDGTKSPVEVKSSYACHGARWVILPAIRKHIFGTPQLVES